MQKIHLMDMPGSGFDFMCKTGCRRLLPVRGSVISHFILFSLYSVIFDRSDNIVLFYLPPA